MTWLFPGGAPWQVKEGQDPGVHGASGPPCEASEPGVPFLLLYREGWLRDTEI